MPNVARIMQDSQCRNMLGEMPKVDRINSVSRRTRPLSEDITCGVVLDTKTRIIKLNMTIVLTTQMTHRKKIMFELRNMKDIVQG